MASILESTLTRAWLRRGPLALALLPLALLFRVLAGLRALLYRLGIKHSGRLPVPVIVVGNIFIGGTGKTPLTIWLAENLRGAGLRPGVISRGHGGAAEAPREVTPQSNPHEVGDEPLLIAARAGCPVVVGRKRLDAGRALLASHPEAPREVTPQSNPHEVGDEPLLIAARAGCPVVVGRKRVEAGRALLSAHPEVDVLIADDGLQHYALARDVEIVLFDGRGVGNGWLLPAGPLREPPSRRRDFTVVNAPEISPALARAVGGEPVRMQLAGDFAEPLMRPEACLPLARLQGRRIVAAAGIGNPGRFFAMLRGAGLSFQELPLPDHHDFLDRPFDRVDADVILITEKDAVKCRQLDNLKDDPRLWVVPVTARIDPALAQQIVEKCRGRSTA